MDGESPFPTEYDTAPPVPIEAAGQIARSTTDADAIPAGLFPDEHVADVGEWTVVRAGIECPQCESNVFLHPESIVPHNTVRRISHYRCNRCGREFYPYE